MSRVKRGVTSHAKHKKVYKAAKGFYGRRKNTIRAAKAGGREGRAIRLPRPQAQEAHLPRALDPAHQRRGASVRHDLQRLYQRPRQVGHHGGPQGAVGSRHRRAGGVPGDRREGQGCAGGLRPAALAGAFDRRGLAQRLSRVTLGDLRPAERVNERYMVPDWFRYLRSQTPHLALIGLLLRRLEACQGSRASHFFSTAAPNWTSPLAPYAHRPRTPSSRGRSPARRSTPR